MSPKRKRRLAAALIGLTFSAVVGVPEHRSHVALESRGVVAPVTLSRYGESDFAGTTAHYQFQTQEGRSVNASVETSEPRAYYERLEVVYDPEDPSHYEEKPVYDRYSRIWMLFFFGLLVPSVVGMMAYGPLHMVAALSAWPESRRPVRSGI